LKLVAVDIGGTQARFAIAEIENRQVVALGRVQVQRVADHPSFELAWEAYAASLSEPVPRAAAIAVASPIGDDVIRLGNNPWILRSALIGERLGVDVFTLVNDFAAIAHAVHHLGEQDFLHLCGPEIALPARGAIMVCGPGTGLGVAQVLRDGGEYHVISRVGGHIDYAPLDAIEDAIVRRLRRTFSRVSCERVVAGPGIVPIYEVLAELAGKPVAIIDDKTIWELALSQRDSLAEVALQRFCLALGSVAGDFALAHGPTAVVIAGGLSYRLRDRLRTSGFAHRFVAKGRFSRLMATIPVKLVVHREPGLFGAAAAFARASARRPVKNNVVRLAKSAR